MGNKIRRIRQDPRKPSWASYAESEIVAAKWQLINLCDMGIGLKDAQVPERNWLTYAAILTTSLHPAPKARFSLTLKNIARHNAMYQQTFRQVRAASELAVVDASELVPHDVGFLGIGSSSWCLPGAGSETIDNEGRLDSEGKLFNLTSEISSEPSWTFSHSRGDSVSTITSTAESIKVTRLLPQPIPNFTTQVATQCSVDLSSSERLNLSRPGKHIRVEKLNGMSEFLALLDTLKEGVMELHLDGEWCGMVMTDLEVKFASKDITYCLDMVQLGPAALDEASISGRTLCRVLEDPKIPVCFYDTRGDQHTMFHQYGLVMKGVIDLQVLFLVATYHPSACYLAGLPVAVKRLILSEEELKKWLDSKTKGKKFCQEHGYEMFLKRPLHPTLEQYAAGDTEYMGHIYAYCMSQGRMQNEFLQDFVLEMSEQRLAEATSPAYNSGDPSHSQIFREFRALSYTTLGIDEPAHEVII